MARRRHADQAAFDLEDAQRRLARMHKVLAERDRLAEEVTRLERELRQAKRKLKEAGWELSVVINSEKRRNGELR